MRKFSGLNAADYVEIQNLYSYYNLCSDAGDAAAYASCFTADGVLEIPALDMVVRSRQQLEVYKRKDKEMRGDRYRRHHNYGLHLEKVDEVTVRGTCYLHGYNGEPGELPVLADAGLYQDAIVKVDGEWLFAKRLVIMDASSFKPPTV